MKKDVCRVSHSGIFSNSQGFSLAELTVVTGLVAMVSLGSAKLIVDAVTTQKSAESNAAAVIVKRDFQNALAGFKRSGAGEMPIEIYNSGVDTSSGCFSEELATGDTGLDIVLNLGDQELKKGVSFPANKPSFDIIDLVFSDAEKVYTDATGSTYLGLVYMTTKNRATNVVSTRQLVANVLLSVAIPPGGGTCAQFASVEDYKTLENDTATCMSMRLHGYASERCQTLNQELATTVPDAITSCAGTGGLPVFQNGQGQAGNTLVRCVKPMQSVCMQQEGATTGSSQRRMLSGFNLIDVTSGNGAKVGEIGCVDVPIPPVIYAYMPQPSIGTGGYTQTTSPSSSKTLSRRKCENLVSAGKVDASIFNNCEDLPSGYAMTAHGSSTAPLDVSNIPTTSPSQPANYASVPCQCGAATISSGAFCGYYFDGKQGYHDDTIVSAVYQCNNGSLDMLTDANGPVSVQRPPEDQLFLRAGGMRPAVVSGSSYVFTTN